MGQPYVGEIRMFAGNFAPVGWAFCDGTPMPISENEVLFQLIGTTYGGDGEETFNLPNLQSRIPIHMGTGPAGITRQIGEMAGVESVTLSTQQIPVHNHAFVASTGVGTQNAPAGEVLASGSTVLTYRPTAPTQPMAAQSINPTGGSQPHENMVPFLCINYIISLFGIYPQQT
jgi:microcystin-dependent protein